MRRKADKDKVKPCTFTLYAEDIERLNELRLKLFPLVESNSEVIRYLIAKEGGV